MMYLVVILTASVVVNLFLFIERQSLTRANSAADRAISSLKRQVHAFRQSFTSVCTQAQQQMQYNYISIEFSDEKAQAVVKYFLDKMPAIMMMQVQTGLPHRKALLQIDDSDGLSLQELEKFFKTQENDAKRLWQSNEPDALLELTQLLMKKALVEMKTKKEKPAS